MRKQKELPEKKDKEVGVETKSAEKNSCPECDGELYFLEAGFLCPVCGYSIETLYID